MSFQVSDLILEFSQGLHCYLEGNQNRDNTIVVESLLDCTHNVLFLTYTFVSECLQSWKRYINPSPSEWPSRKINSQAKWGRGGKYGTFLLSIQNKRTEHACPCLGFPGCLLYPRGLNSCGRRLHRQPVTAAYGHCVSTVGCSWHPFSLWENSLWKRGMQRDPDLCQACEMGRCLNASTAKRWMSTDMLKELGICFGRGKLSG